MRWVFRALFLSTLLIGGYVLAERFTVYAFDPRQVTPDIPGVSEQIVSNSSGGNMVVWTARPKRGKPTILYLHGNAGNLNNRTPRLRAITDRGYGIVAPGFRGSSGSAGWPTEKAIRADTKGLYSALLDGRLTGTPTRPIIYGESIGAAVAIHLLEDINPDIAQPKAIVLEAPFTSLVDVAKAIQPELALATGLMVNRWNSINYAANLIAPLLILHGSKDQLIPVDQGRQIFEEAKSPSKEFFEVEGAGHINVWKIPAQKRLYRFLSGVS